MPNQHEFRTLHALTEQQLADLLSFFVTRGWKTLGSSRLLRPDDLHRLPRLEQVVYREELAGVCDFEVTSGADHSPDAS